MSQRLAGGGRDGHTCRVHDFRDDSTASTSCRECLRASRRRCWAGAGSGEARGAPGVSFNCSSQKDDLVGGGEGGGSGKGALGVTGRNLNFGLVYAEFIWLNGLVGD